MSAVEEYRKFIVPLTMGAGGVDPIIHYADAAIAELEAERAEAVRIGGIERTRADHAEAELAALKANRAEILDSAWNTANERAIKAEAERDALRDELRNVIRQWSDDYRDLAGYPVDVTELSALAQAVWAAASTTA